MVRYNFYQSPVWRNIQKEIYDKPTFSIELFSKEYLGVIKEKKVGPFTMKRYQVLGVEIPLHDEELIKKEFSRIKKEFSGGMNLHFQLGILNEIFVYDIESELSSSFAENILQMRDGVTKMMQDKFGLCPAFVENMPLANLFYDIPQQEEFYDWFFSGKIRRKIRKSFKDGLEFRAVKTQEKELFWKHWNEIAGYQQFAVITHESYGKLFDYLKSSGNGEIFATFMDGEIMSGGIYIFNDEVVTYLYGFNRRLRNNLGGQHALTYAALQEFSVRGFKKMDACGVSPTGVENHYLSTISYVKEALIGCKIDHYGNFDLVLQPFLYRLYKFLKKSK